MKILHIVPGLHNSSGPTHIVNSLASHMALANEEVSLFHVRRRKESEVFPDHPSVHIATFEPSWPFIFEFSNSFKQALRRQVNNFDIVHIHSIWNYPTDSAMRICKDSNVPYVVSPQGSLSSWAMRHKRLRKKLAYFGERNLFNAAAAIHAVSPQEAREAKINRITASCSVIPNGVEPDIFENIAPDHELRRKLDLEPDTRLLLFLARLHPKKGLDILADAFARFSQNNNKWILIIAGSDAGDGYQQQVQKLFRNAGVENRCRFIGEVCGTKKLELLLSVDAYVLPSYTEGLPISVLEAMAAGLPVIITSECNILEVKEYNAGRVIAVDADALANAFHDILNTPEYLIQMGKKRQSFSL